MALRPSCPRSLRRRPDLLAAPAAALEPLERRMLLAAAPMPELSDLQDPDHTVVRLETSLGAIDVELFDHAAPDSVAAFLSRVGQGDLDRTLFDRLTPASLEAGAYTHDAIAGVRPAPAAISQADAAISNVPRTVAIRAGEGAGLRISLEASAPPTDSHWTVIGRIADDASWAIVESIASLPVADLRDDLPGATGAALESAPVAAGAPVRIIDAEVIKAAGQGEFFTHSIAYPEGFSGSTVDEFVPIVNPNGEAVTYQVILRFERDPANPFAKRDAVVATGTVAAHSRGGVTVWTGATDFPASTADSLITPGRPYAIEVRSTLPLAATLSHYDFGSATGEGFSSRPQTSWAMTGGVKGEGVFDFLVWYNTGGGDASVTVTLYPEAGPALDPIVITTEAYRRGGLDLSGLASLPDGRFAAMITSDQPLVAALSHYQPGGPVEGYTGLGAHGPAVTGGAIPLARFGDSPDAGTVTLSFINPAAPPEPCEDDHQNDHDHDDEDHGDRVTICHRPPGNPDNVQIITIARAALEAHLAHGDSLWTPEEHCDCDESTPPPPCPPAEVSNAVITITLRFEDESIPDLVLPDVLTLGPSRSGHIRLDSSVIDMTPYLGQRFTVLYSASREVYAGMSATDGFDGVSTEVATQGSTRTLFAEGFSDPARAGADVFETIAVHFPAPAAIAAVEPATVTVVFMYTDGAVVEVERALVAGRTLFLDVHSLQEVLDQGEDHHRYFYSIEVLANVPVLGQMVHLDTNLGRDGNAAGGFTTMGMPMEALAG